MGYICTNTHSQLIFKDCFRAEFTLQKRHKPGFHPYITMKETAYKTGLDIPTYQLNDRIMDGKINIYR